MNPQADNWSDRLVGQMSATQDAVRRLQLQFGRDANLGQAAQKEVESLRRVIGECRLRLDKQTIRRLFKISGDLAVSINLLAAGGGFIQGFTGQVRLEALKDAQERLDRVDAEVERFIEELKDSSSLRRANPEDGDKRGRESSLDRSAAPRVFISYSWDSEEHKMWVRGLGTRLRRDGIDARLDEWELFPGDQLPAYMESAIRQSSFVLAVMTPDYKVKADGRKGGVGYEGNIITDELFRTAEQRKFIPVLRRGDRDTAAPTWVSGKVHVDLRGDPYDTAEYDRLLNALLGKPAYDLPPLGTRGVGGSAGRWRTVAGDTTDQVSEDAVSRAVDWALSRSDRPTADELIARALQENDRDRERASSAARLIARVLDKREPGQ